MGAVTCRRTALQVQQPLLVLFAAISVGGGSTARPSLGFTVKPMRKRRKSPARCLCRQHLGDDRLGGPAEVLLGNLNANWLMGNGFELRKSQQWVSRVLLGTS